MKRPARLLRLWLLCVSAAALLAAQASAGPTAPGCPPTPVDAFGPFGRGIPPIRSSIGKGHVLSGVVLSALDCRALRGAQVQFWQSNRNGQYTRAGSATVIADRAGRFRFEGPFPASYEGRPPHIHIRVIAKGYLPLLVRYVPAKGERSATIRLVLVPEEV